MEMSFRAAAYEHTAQDNRMDFRLQTLIPSSLTQDFILRSLRHLPSRGHNKPGLLPCRAAFPYKQRALLPVAETQRLGLVEMPRHTCISVTWLHPAEWHVRRNAGNAQFQRARVKRHPHPGNYRTSWEKLDRVSGEGNSEGCAPCFESQSTWPSPTCRSGVMIRYLSAGRRRQRMQSQEEAMMQP